MLKKCYFFIFILGMTCTQLQGNKSEERVETSRNEKEQNEKKNSLCDFKEEFSETKHEIRIDGELVSYKATAGNLILKDEKGNPNASVFFVSYVKQGMEDSIKRPVTFCFNGGPGSSSVWLHLGAFGPKRVDLTDEGDAMPPYTLIDNEFSILNLTDLVFIDPISTGYSQAIPREDAKKYHGYEEDIKSVASFIRLYITRFNRWESPKFLAGESYGTTRAAGLAGRLHDEEFIYMNGIILVSSVLNFQSIQFDAGNDLSYLMYLPSYTAAAWYHKKLSPDLQKDLIKAVEESKNFVSNEYSQALFKGDLLTSDERQHVIKKISHYSGLSPQYVGNNNLRVNIYRFAKELLRDQRKTVGRFDSRFMGVDSDQAGETFEYDPSTEAIFGAFTSTLNYYMRNDLKWEKDAEYKILANISSQWDFSVATNQYLNVTDKLKNVMVRNPHLHVFIASGYYDLATPFFGTEYTFNHLGLDPIFQKHVDMHLYQAGHMMYNHYPSLVKLKKDLSNYYIQTLKEQENE